jgi:GH18 family chitinase
MKRLTFRIRNNPGCRRGAAGRATTLVIAISLVLPVGADDAPADDSNGRGRRPFIVAGYLPWYRAETWSPAAIGPVTDLIYFGARLRADGRLNAETLNATALERLAAAHQASGCRLLLCVGGGDRSAGFAAATADETSRQRLCDSLVALCRAHGFGGVDFDWEYPEGDRQLHSFAQLLAEMKRRLGEEGVVSVAQSPWRDFGRDVYRIVDRVHVMSYNHRHPQARFEDSQRDVERMLEYGCPADKLVLGVPFYGRNAAGRTKTFQELAGFGRLEPDADMLLGYAFNGRATVRAKTRYALDRNLGGIMVWELGQDAADADTSLLRGIELELGQHTQHESTSRQGSSRN